MAFLMPFVLFGQKVGVVLSGGGASGLAHIGVLKALEEHHIPVDYITGTSIGALVGAMYSIGYSPSQIETIVTSTEFQSWAYGEIENKYVYYFKRKDDNASWITFKLSLDSAIEGNLPTNIISPVPVDFALMEKTAAAIAAAGYNFDSLFIPFRCIAADIERKQPVVFRKGDLGESVRASMSYPFYLKPISIDGKLLFDGGIYNNFPSNVMTEDFYPDIIIGSNVTGNAPPPHEDNLLSQLKAMLLTKTDYNIPCENGIIIQPVTNVALFDFKKPQPLIDSGYIATLRALPKIQLEIQRRISNDELQNKRARFFQKQTPLVFENIDITGVNRSQAAYIKRILNQRHKTTTIEKIKPSYFRLASDDKIKSIFPKAKYNSATQQYGLQLNIKKEKDLFVQAGGNFSNRPISEGFVGAQYNYLGKIATTLMGNTYFGKLYSSAQAKVRFDFPTRFPFYLEPGFTINRWDFFTSQDAFFVDQRPSYLIQRDQFAELNAGVPVGNKGTLTLGGGVSSLGNDYYQTNSFTEKDTADRTNFNFYTFHALLERNTLNRKQYANQGLYFSMSARYINGFEENLPGTTAIKKDKFSKQHQWGQLKVVFDNYFKQKGVIRLGFYFEAMYSIQNLFNNYSASILAAPAFQPIPECKTLFLENYRAFKYYAIGLKNVMNIYKNFDLRLEGYIYNPYEQIVRKPDNTATLGTVFAKRYFIGTSALVYNTIIGPLSVSVNYYDQEQKQFSFLFHFGYILFNKRATD